MLVTLNAIRSCGYFSRANSVLKIQYLAPRARLSKFLRDTYYLLVCYLSAQMENMETDEKPLARRLSLEFSLDPTTPETSPMNAPGPILYGVDPLACSPPCQRVLFGSQPHHPIKVRSMNFVFNSNILSGWTRSISCSI